MEQAGRLDLLHERRSAHQTIGVTGRSILLRDQAPLHRGNMELPSGYSFERFVESLNRRVFFWPGTEEQPISYGVRHFRRYENENPVILRTCSDSLHRRNPQAVPLFCRYNSGSPRCSRGKKSPRGPDTFVPAQEFDGTAADVAEVTFTEEIFLPDDTEMGRQPKGPWHPLKRNIPVLGNNL